MKKIFLICPVRNIDDLYQNAIEDQVRWLEAQGNSVYYPSRDTNQTLSELEICEKNREALSNADEVYIIWDGKSQGVLFDLGMAFALKKKVRAIIGYVPSMSRGKSFGNLIHSLDDLS